MRLLVALFFAAAFPVAAQTPQVPHKMDFAGITLIIRDDARREIQKDVNALTASPKYYNIKVERAKTYFPIIEKIFREEGLPDDFKYLVLQESALISDAVSSSDAVGFWQFKDFTALEMGLRIDREIDERMNIVSSTRAAARYLIKNNQFFDNWLYALQAYQMGAGGVMKTVEDTQAKATRMEITGKTYWYVKKFLAHKIAYEDGVKGRPAFQVVTVENRSPMTLRKLAKETSISEDALRDLNKWTKSGDIPGDRTYVVLLPVEDGRIPHVVIPTVAAADPGEHRQASGVDRSSQSSVRGKVNGVHTLQAVAGDDAHSLADRGGADLAKFLKWNDLSLKDPIIPGQFYFLGRKRLKASEAFHKVRKGETLWSVSQQYGVQIKRLRRYNRMEKGVHPAPGTMLFMASKRPKADHVIADVESPVEVNTEETFNWSVKTQTTEPVSENAEALNLQPVPEKAVADTLAKPVDSRKILQANKTEVTLGDPEPSISVPLPESGEHTVKAGETLYSIGKLYSITVMELVGLNKLDLQQGIHPGQVLRLREGQKTIAAAQDRLQAVEEPLNGEIFHEVKTADTLYSIARQYNVTIKEIMEWNEKNDFSLSVGEKLRIVRGQ